MASSTFPNNLINLASQGKVCRTLGIKFITSPEIIYIARNAGFHALFIDLEHSSLSLETASHLCVTGMNAGLSPIVRVPGQAGPGFIQRVLDNGAQGVIVPHVDTVEQALSAVKSAKYPPLGKRSVTGMLPHMGYRSASIADVSSIGNAQLSTVVVMIESPEAVANADAIAAVEGVDVVLVGTNDLSIELGIAGDFDHPSFVESMEKIAAAVKRHGKILGVAGIYNRPDLLRGYIKQLGARFVVGHVDLPMVAKVAGATAEELVKLEEE
ncbi:Pyruvate/Phosphoenolpyruvate kinase-like domain-containing protein [Aspergillus keveii]|uniref:Pyruvate/Phosphoenolpyruvate kinase-like domain-containing protein n=1 Tax=Aspergillus keveii TaxID=714993 RepID=A0ABR4G0N0_9EURO